MCDYVEIKQFNLRGYRHMRDIILGKLKEIERENDIKILYAIESGSRGWGFESKDSDYDVRFIYAHKPEWYLSIQEKRNVVELPINDLLDINGWDIRKALMLFRKSNPTLLEWLNSPIIYIEESTLISKMKKLMEVFFSSKSCIYHYLHMAEGNYREYLKGEVVRVKKYFYVLRPIMACMWTEKYGTQPPMLFEELMNSLHLDRELVQEINKLLVIKRSAKEMDNHKSIKIINEFLEEKIKYYKNYVKELDSNQNYNIEVLDELLIDILQEIWEFKI